MEPEYLKSEGYLPQEKIPGQGVPSSPVVQVLQRKMQPSYWTAPVGVRPSFVKLELDRDANHIVVKNAGYYIDPTISTGYPSNLSANLVFYWGTIASQGGVLRSGELVTFDGVFLRNTVLLFQTTAASFGISDLILNAEVYYW